MAAEMKDLIHRLMDIEEKARSIAAEEIGHLKNLDAELAAAEAEKNSEIEKMALEQVKKMAAHAESETDERLKEIEEKTGAATDELTELFDKKGREWARRVYEDIIAL